MLSTKSNYSINTKLDSKGKELKPRVTIQNLNNATNASIWKTTAKS
jgi:hypothetical protein